MIKRYWTTKQMPNLHKFAEKNRIPDEVEEGIQNILKILDSFYGSEREVDKDYGGCVYVIIPDKNKDISAEYRNILDRYKVKKENSEFNDIIFEKDNLCWHSDLYIPSCEYGITIVYPKVKHIRVQNKV